MPACDMPEQPTQCGYALVGPLHTCRCRVMLDNSRGVERERLRAHKKALGFFVQIAAVSLSLSALSRFLLRCAASRPRRRARRPLRARASLAARAAPRRAEPHAPPRSQVRRHDVASQVTRARHRALSRPADEGADAPPARRSSRRVVRGESQPSCGLVRARLAGARSRSSPLTS
jgi:hypothetical protein